MLLFLTTGPFFPDDRGGKTRTLFFLRQCAEKQKICILSFVSSRNDIQELKKLHALKNIEYVYYCKTLKRTPYRRIIKNTVSPASVFCEKYMSVSFAEKMRKILKDHPITSVFFSHFHLCRNISYIPDSMPCFIDLQNIESQLMRSYISADHPFYAAAASIQYLKLKYEQQIFLPKFHHIFTCCSADEHSARSYNEHVSVIPNIARKQSLNYIHTAEPEFDLSFCGALNYLPNRTAAEKLCSIMKKLPHRTCIIVGKGMNKAQKENVCYTGYVAHTAEHIKKARIFAAPVQHGGGTKLKIIEAAALKMPIITTTEGVRGLNMKHGIHCIVSPTKDFHKNIEVLLNNTSLQKQLAHNAYDHISLFSEQRTADVLQQQLHDLYNRKDISEYQDR